MHIHILEHYFSKTNKGIAAFLVNSIQKQIGPLLTLTSKQKQKHTSDT